ncbi:UNVERIFIED_CONTAM: hypothetical protein GTU68_009466 [Idotea baltica]|nr:hypothetical protein [Idotea baltica]MCL4130794.1 hypothetical protein [Idotea baltica]
MDFKKVVKKLNEFAPLSLAESWDNVGVLIEPPNMRPVSKLLLTNDLTLAVMDEAEEKGVDMILSYHPPIFKPLKTITCSHWKEQIVGRCIAKGIALYSPHTSYDAVSGGVNDWLISAFGKGDMKPILPSFSPQEWTHKIQIHDEEALVESDLHELLSREFIENTYLIRDASGKNVSVFCGENLLPKCVAFVTSLPMKTRISISKVEPVPLAGHGMGREMNLESSMTLKEAIKAVQNHLGLPGVRVAVAHGGTQENVIKSVAVCAGAGISVLRLVKADLILTGEMSHHDVLELVQRGSNVILTDHSNSERGFLSAVLKDKLDAALGSAVQVVVSTKDEDPLKIVCS